MFSFCIEVKLYALYGEAEDDFSPGFRECKEVLKTSFELRKFIK